MLSEKASDSSVTCEYMFGINSLLMMLIADLVRVSCDVVDELGTAVEYEFATLIGDAYVWQ